MYASSYYSMQTHLSIYYIYLKTNRQEQFLSILLHLQFSKAKIGDCSNNLNYRMRRVFFIITVTCKYILLIVMNVDLSLFFSLDRLNIDSHQFLSHNVIKK